MMQWSKAVIQLAECLKLMVLFNILKLKLLGSLKISRGVLIKSGLIAYIHAQTQDSTLCAIVALL